VVVALLEHQTGASQTASLEGIGRSSPFAAHALTVFFLSLIGLPPLIGFTAKYRVIVSAGNAARSADSYVWLDWLTGAAVICMLLPAVYFGRIIFRMYSATRPSPYRIRVSGLPSIALFLCLIGVILFGLLPEPILHLADEMIKSFGLMPR
jgi:NADH-quinone oxidoreductase subunit N